MKISKTVKLNIVIILSLFVSTLNVGIVQGSSANQSDDLKAQAAQIDGLNAKTLSLAELLAVDPNRTYQLTGHYDKMKFDIGMPSNWEVHESELRLHLSTNVGAEGAIPAAEVRVLLNRLVVFTTLISTPGDTWISIPLPSIWGTNDGFKDRIEVIINAEASCDQNLLHTSTIYMDSEISFIYDEIPPKLDLRSYPKPFFDNSFLDQQASVVLSENPSKTELEAALSLAAELGRVSGDDMGLVSFRGMEIENTEAVSQHLFVVGTPDNNPFIDYLYRNQDMPVQLNSRRGDLSITAQNIVASNLDLPYTISFKNTTGNTLENLTMNVYLPADIVFETIACQPACTIENQIITWEMGSIVSGLSIETSLVLSSAFMTKISTLDITAALYANSQPINVSTHQSAIAKDGDIELVTASAKVDHFFVADGIPVAESDGIIQIIISPWNANKVILLVTGLDDTAVLKAGRSLGYELEFPRTSGQAAFVREIYQNDISNFDFRSEFSFSDYGYTDQIIEGVGQETNRYQFYLPPQVGLSTKAKINFMFSHSALIDASQSSLTLIFNDVPFASVALDETNTQQGTIEALLPVKYAKQGRMNTIEVLVNLQLTNECASVTAATNQAWANLLSDSFLQLPVVDQLPGSEFDLDFMPFPFAAENGLKNTVFILPENSSSVEQTIALQLAMYFGAFSEAKGFSPSVVLGNEIDSAFLEERQIIMVGLPSRMPIMQTINDQLPQPFVPNKNLIKQEVDDVVFRLPDGIDLGFIQLLPSSWNPEKNILVLTGTSETAMTWAIDALKDPDKNDFVMGNLVITPNNNEVFAVNTLSFVSGSQEKFLEEIVPDLETIEPTEEQSELNIPTDTAEPSESPEENRSNTSGLIIGSISIGGILITAILGFVIWKSRRQVG